MKVKAKYFLLVAPLLLSAIGGTWNALGGASERSEPSSDVNNATDETNTKLSGEELWSNNCQRCHNLRTPTMHTPAQWQVIMLHMRVRANLTGEDARAITDFLKSASR
jgi:cytochrome c5